MYYWLVNVQPHSDLRTATFCLDAIMIATDGDEAESLLERIRNGFC